MSDANKPREMPKGGRKGGTQFPQVPLKKAAEYAKKLVSKTHTGPQPAAVILKGVFGSKSGRGQVRAGALKQYGLMEGPADAYTASDLSKILSAAPADELQMHLRTAFLRANVYRTLYDTFVGDTVSRAKISQQAAALNVHPDSLTKATQFFVEGAVHAGLATTDGDSVTIIRADVLSSGAAPAPTGGNDDTQEDGEEDVDAESDAGRDNAERGQPAPHVKSSARAIATVAIKVDPSTHTDDLEKQLKLLRKFGVI